MESLVIRTDYQYRSLPAKALEPLVKALLDELPEDDSSSVPAITVRSEGLSSSPVAKQSRKQNSYDPSVAYILEFCTVLALRDAQTVELLGKPISDALQAILREPGRHHSILVSRVAFYQFSVLKASYVGSSQVIFVFISCFAKLDTRNTTSYGLRCCCTLFLHFPRSYLRRPLNSSCKGSNHALANLVLFGVRS
jgi:golgi-specific brefeldin A-resistance guanine nucleotide exchange factor 1